MFQTTTTPTIPTTHPDPLTDPRLNADINPYLIVRRAYREWRDAVESGAPYEPDQRLAELLPQIHEAHLQLDKACRAMQRVQRRADGCTFAEYLSARDIVRARHWDLVGLQDLAKARLASAASRQ